MLLSEINPYIRLAMRSVLSPGCHVNRRIIMDYELIYVEEGEFNLSYAEQDFVCQTGDILLICPGIPNEFKVGEIPVSQPHIHFDISYDSLSRKIGVCFQDRSQLSEWQLHLIRTNSFSELNKNPFLNICDREKFLNTFFRIVDCENKNTLSCKADMLILIEMILSDHNLKEFQEIDCDRTIAHTVKEYLEANYEKDISLDQLSRQFSCSKFYLEKSFQCQYGFSVIAFRNRLKMQAALQLLSRYTVSEVGQRLGFSSIYAFSRAFKDYYGASPSKFMKANISPDTK